MSSSHALSRRQFIGTGAAGVAGVSLADMLAA